MDEKKLKDLRSQIDTIDTQIVELLAERFKLALPIARTKQNGNVDIYDSTRENAVISRLDNYGAECGLPLGVVPCVYELIFDFMKDYQRNQGND